MSHLFVAPHSDDVALSCGGLIAVLRARGEAVSIVTVFSGARPSRQLTRYQREALGFGQRGTEKEAADLAESVMAARRAEDTAYAALVGASIVHLDLPDAVFRGYEGDDELMGELRSDDSCPLDELHLEIAALAPAAVYFPLGVGGHVDHQQARNAGLAVLAAEPTVPASPRIAFYDDVPYTYRLNFHGLGDLPPNALADLPDRFTLAPEYVEIAAVLDRKIEALQAYGSQLARQFGGADEMVEAMTAAAARTGADRGVGPAERYWLPVRRIRSTAD